MRIGAPTGKTFIRHTLQAENGFLYILGNVDAPGGKRHGFLQQLDYEGNIAWTKQYELSSRNLIFESIAQNVDGTLLIAGSTSQTDGSDKKPFISSLDETGIVHWNKIIDSPGYQGAAVSVEKNMGIGFAAHDDSTLLYFKLDWNGNIVLSRKLRVAEKGQVVGIGNAGYNLWHIGYTGVDSGRQVGVVIDVDMLSGNVSHIKRLGGLSKNADFIMHDFEVTNLRSHFAGIYSDNNGPYQFFEAIFNQGAVDAMITLTVAGKTIDPTAKINLSNRSESIAFTFSASDPEVYAFGFTSVLPFTSRNWQKKFTLPSASQLVNIEQGFDGGFYISTNIQAAATDTQGLLLKTDSLGVIKNCEGTPFDLNMLVHTNQYITVISGNSTTISPSSVFITSGVSNTMLPHTTECKNLACPVQQPIEQCFTSFVKRYRSASARDHVSSLYIDELDQVHLLGGASNISPRTSLAAGTISTMDNQGRVLNRKQFTIGSSTVSREMITLNDGNVLIAGTSDYPSPFTGRDTAYITITKLTPGFGLIWNKSFLVTTNNTIFHGIVQDEAGNIFMSYSIGFTLCDASTLIKLDPSGNLVWRRDYKIPNACGINNTGSIMQDQHYIYFAHWAAGPQGMLLYKVEKVTGALAWVKTYNAPNTSQVNLAQDMAMLGSKIVLHGSITSQNGGSGYPVIMTIDIDGNILQAKEIRLPGNIPMRYKMAVTRNKEIVLVGAIANNVFIRLDSNLSVLHSKQINLQTIITNSVKEAADGSIYAAGNITGSDRYRDFGLQRFSPEGLVGSCFSDTLIVSTPTAIITMQPATATTTPMPLPLYSLPYSEAPYSLQENAVLCANIANCNTINLTGTKDVCDTLEHTITANRNTGCNTPVYFSYTGDKIKMISKTDSTFTFKFSESGSSTIKARIFTGCVWVEDETNVQANIQNIPALDLGTDKELCPGNTLELKAQPGYASYLWNDGSTQPTLSITAEGEYHIKAMDACGNEQADTILITLAAPVPVSLGGDREKCNNDTIHLKAPDGFISYIWGPDYNLSASGQTAIIAPGKDTAYYIRAEKSPGCYGFDTIQVKVKTSPPVFLGNDTSFCTGHKLLLDAGPGFSQYLWSNSASSSSIEVSATGSYSVIAATVEGCRSFDTLTVLNTWPLPVIDLDKTSHLCIGESRTFNAGTFNSYLWHDGSTQPTFTANTTGTYYVTVTDQRSCEGTDTAVIRTIAQNPSGFLPPDTAICSYGSFLLKSNANYRSYLWNTNSTASSISITSPGNFWLQVKDNNGCVGKDSIKVDPKKCLEGFFAPTAFTPNNDGHNDAFKPYALGNVVSYRLSVFNRWGQMVFQTTDPNKGWDGKFAGVQQDSNVFAWICTFRFEGQEERNEKGTVTLIR
ncbi:MAG: gliding motility-associated C-terminal domain-containing protein [Chitinophagaceae bacterium]